MIEILIYSALVAALTSVVVRLLLDIYDSGHDQPQAWASPEEYYEALHRLTAVPPRTISEDHHRKKDLSAPDVA